MKRFKSRRFRIVTLLLLVSLIFNSLATTTFAQENVSIVDVQSASSGTEVEKQHASATPGTEVKDEPASATPGTTVDEDSSNDIVQDTEVYANTLMFAQTYATSYEDVVVESGVSTSVDPYTYQRASSSNTSIATASNSQYSSEVTITGKSVGTTTVTIHEYRKNGRDYYATGDTTVYTVTVVEKFDFDDYQNPVKAPEPVAAEEGDLEAGELSTSKTATWNTNTSNPYDANITFSLAGMPIETGSDVILVVDRSGSMGPGSSWDGYNDCWDETVSSVNQMTATLLANNNEDANRVALVTFSGEDVSESINFTTDATTIASGLAGMTPDNGTYYDSALSKAIEYANSIKADNTGRPLYIVFISDGEPSWRGGNWNGYYAGGTTEANTLKSSSYNAKIYSIAIGSGFSSYLQAISSDGTCVVLDNNANGLNDTLEKIASQIQYAATNAYVVDTISEYFVVDAKDLPSGMTLTTVNGKQVVTIDVGTIIAAGEDFVIPATLKTKYQGDPNVYPTNDGAILTYDDVDGDSKTYEGFDGPKLTVEGGSISVQFYIVEPDTGKYYTENGNTTDDITYATAKFTTNYTVDGSAVLKISQEGITYAVDATEYLAKVHTQGAYELYTKDDVKNIILTTSNSDQIVTFKIIDKPAETYSVTYKADDKTSGELPTDLLSYEEGESVTVQGQETIARTGYTFAGWEYAGKVYQEGDSFTMPANHVTFEAKWIINNYTITFEDEDGSELSSEIYAYGSEVTVPTEPTKEATSQYTYTFAGWSPSVTTVTGDATYKATYKATVNSYTITFEDEDGSKLSSDLYAYGSEVAVPENPTKEATAEFTYTFAGWSPKVATVTGDATYKATYKATVNSYTITFEDEDGSKLSSDLYAYGS
ncbi:MAG: VWA domain-containing protein, partial [Lachnospiraceae bacterium]